MINTTNLSLWFESVKKKQMKELKESERKERKITKDFNESIRKLSLML